MSLFKEPFAIPNSPFPIPKKHLTLGSIQNTRCTGIYFGQIGTTIVLILCGGDKSTQQRDIRTAIEYWREYRSRDNA